MWGCCVSYRWSSHYDVHPLLLFPWSGRMSPKHFDQSPSHSPLLLISIRADCRPASRKCNFYTESLYPGIHVLWQATQPFSCTVLYLIWKILRGFLHVTIITSYTVRRPKKLPKSRKNWMITLLRNPDTQLGSVCECTHRLNQCLTGTFQQLWEQLWGHSTATQVHSTEAG